MPSTKKPCFTYLRIMNEREYEKQSKTYPPGGGASSKRRPRCTTAQLQSSSAQMHCPPNPSKGCPTFPQVGNSRVQPKSLKPQTLQTQGRGTGGGAGRGLDLTFGGTACRIKTRDKHGLLPFVHALEKNKKTRRTLGVWATRGSAVACAPISSTAIEANHSEDKPSCAR